jgi:hypothetical protein
MSRYVTESYFNTVRTLPIALAQTELKRETSLRLCSINLVQGEVLEMHALNLQVIRFLTPGVSPSSEISIFGVASVGLQLGGMATGMIGVVPIDNVGVASHVPYQPCRITAPGLYHVVVRNHANNVDMSVSVTGSVKIFK